jgi:hypothetical protein
MATSDDVVRAQARALIRVLIDYNLDRRFGIPTPLWRAVETLGRDGGTSTDLQAIGRKYAGAAAAAFCVGVKHRSPNAALYLALASFTRVSPAYRFLDPSRWIALCFAFMNKRAVAGAAVQGEVLERLEAAFEAEIDEYCDRVVGQGQGGRG